MTAPMTALQTGIDDLARRVRPDFPILDLPVRGKRLAYLDNAATSQKPRPVLGALATFYETSNANVHRGIHDLSERATIAYEDARARLAAFFGISDPAELIWTRGTTEGLNLVASSWARHHLRPGDEILLTVMEHHSNLVPWQLAAEATGAKLRFIGIDGEQRLDLSNLDELLTERTKIVSLCHISNALGTINPVRDIAARAHAVGAVVAVDAAQSAPHLPIAVEELGCDFLAFSGHKMCGPTGIGALWGRRALLEGMPPYHGGGDMIDNVELERSTYAPLPHRFEAGTPHIAGAIGLAAAADYLDSVGRDAIVAQEDAIVRYGLERLSKVEGLRIFGPSDPDERAGVISFEIDGIHPHDLSTIVDSDGVAIRAGHHCTQPLMRHLGVAATARASFAFYNTREDVDQLVAALENARTLFTPGGA